MCESKHKEQDKPMLGFDRESYFLSLLQKSGITKGVGDDCCILDCNASPYHSTFCHSPYSRYTPPPSVAHKAHIHAQDITSFLVGADSFCEGVHFLMKWFSPYDIAYKAFLVNYSDIIAMNATPLYATLSVALPKSWQKAEIKDFVRGIETFCRSHSIKLIGGDTITALSLQIHITLFAKKSKHTLYRDKIPLHSLLCYTSDRYPRDSITQISKVLKNLLNTHKYEGFKAKNTNINTESTSIKPRLKAKGRFLRPTIRTGFIRECAPFLRGGMDISDGILSDIVQLCTINRLGFKAYFPIFAPRFRHLLHSGETYEMLLAIAPKDRLKIQKRAAKHRIRIHTLGKLTRKKYILPRRKIWH
ncbi:thiamine-phosphate kinase [Helicobacter typhlonius]|uniref:thiamine-phosphate kinase n=1 Tax=Helicobacter typhlonius TaxID=76936 RepID=UPI002FE1E6B4